MGLSGLEPPTSRLSGVRSNRLSYRPIGSFFRWVFSLFSHIFFSISSCKCTIVCISKLRLYIQKWAKCSKTFSVHFAVLNIQAALVHSKINSTQFLDRPLGIFGFPFISSSSCSPLQVISRSDWISFQAPRTHCTQAWKKSDMNRNSP